MDTLDGRLLEEVQREVPLVARPFAEVASRLGVAEDDVIARMSRLTSDGILREISAVMEPAAFGRRSALVAFAVDDAALDRVGERAAKHPGVSHCYARDAAYNLWFTLSVGRDADPEDEAAKLAQAEGVRSRMVLPALRVFKIALLLRFTDRPVEQPTPPPAAQPGPVELSTEDRAAAGVLQRDLPIMQRPFEALAAQAGMSEEELLDRARSLVERGVIRRYAAALRHVRAGYRANAMVCWNVPAAQIEEIGMKLAADPSISHCYERPVASDWPYPLYTMIHCRTDDELRRLIGRLARSVGEPPHVILRTTREYKKSRIRYLPLM